MPRLVGLQRFSKDLIACTTRPNGVGVCPAAPLVKRSRRRAEAVEVSDCYPLGRAAGAIGRRVEQQDSAALNPTGRMATAQEVANAVVFLSSSVASFISDTCLLVDGTLTRGVQF